MHPPPWPYSIRPEAQPLTDQVQAKLPAELQAPQPLRLYPVRAWWPLSPGSRSDQILPPQLPAPQPGFSTFQTMSP